MVARALPAGHASSLIRPEIPPLLDRCRLARPEDDTHNAKIYGVDFCGAFRQISPRQIIRNLRIQPLKACQQALLEAEDRRFNRSGGLCFSWRPPGSVCHHNIGTVEAAAGFQNPVQLPGDVILSGARLIAPLDMTRSAHRHPPATPQRFLA